MYHGGAVAIPWVLLFLLSVHSLADDNSKLSPPLNNRDALVNTKQSAKNDEPGSSEENSEQRGTNIKKRPSKCVPIEIPMCKDIGYNLTYLPNEFNHMSQDEAGLEVHQFWPLVTIQCSKDLRLFLCSMYAPICVPEWPRRVPPCRSLCQSARDGCAPIMLKYGFTWPAKMDCEKLPDNQNGKACMSKSTNRTTTPISKPQSCECSCRRPLITSHAYFNSVITGGEQGCLMSCHSPHFKETETNFAKIWIAVGAFLCLASTLITVTTFLIDMSRFKYPEKPIIFLSGCYLMVSIAYTIRVLAGHDFIVCNQLKTLHYEAQKPIQCGIVFLLLYFFGMASSIWWVILTVTWFLAAGLKWGSEAIAKYSPAYHFVAWGLPVAKSLIAILTNSIDGDPVIGVCYIGNTSLLTLKVFVIVPLCVYLGLGTFFLLAGFISLFRIRNVIKAQGDAKIDKLEKLMIRIGIFGVLYTVPATVVICCYFYELHYREAWDRAHNCQCPTVSHQMKSLEASKFSDIAGKLQERDKPEFFIFMLRFFMCVAVGMTSSLWIWTRKTLNSWRMFCFRIRCIRSPPPQRNQYKYSVPQNSAYPVQGGGQTSSLVGGMAPGNASIGFANALQLTNVTYPATLPPASTSGKLMSHV